MTVKSAEVLGTEFFLKLDVDASKFKPGTYDGKLVVRSPYLSSNRTPISVSRSESRIWIPILIGAITGLAGLIWFALLRGASQAQLTVEPRWLLVLSGVCMVAGMVAVFISYWDQNVWTLDENGRQCGSGLHRSNDRRDGWSLGSGLGRHLLRMLRGPRGENGNGQATSTKSRITADSADADR